VNTARLQANIGQWEAAKAQYDRYLELKDQSVTYQYYDSDGQLKTGSIPLWDPDNAPPPDPGAAPTSLSDTGKTSTTAQLDDKNRIISETSEVTTDNGLRYTETTTYTYGDPDGDGKEQVVGYQTTVTHSDGSTETITKTTNPDLSYVVTDQTKDGTSTTTVTPKPDNGGYTSVTKDHDGQTTTTDVTVNAGGPDRKTVDGPDGVDEYTGDDATGQWTLDKHTDPPPDPTYLIF
jgi:hypothetical protein